MGPEPTTAEKKTPGIGLKGTAVQPADAPVNPDEPPSLRFYRTLVMTAITWPRRLGRPVGMLTQAFVANAYAYMPVPELPGAYLKLPCGHDLLEGPHDEANWRVTLVTNWRDPEGWGAAKDNSGSRTNTIEVAINSAWDAIPGLGAPFLVPASQSYEHPQTGLLTLPSFQVRRF